MDLASLSESVYLSMDDTAISNALTAEYAGGTLVEYAIRSSREGPDKEFARAKVKEVRVYGKEISITTGEKLDGSSGQPFLRHVDYGLIEEQADNGVITLDLRPLPWKFALARPGVEIPSN
ncbi:MAG: hypothetical protein ABIE22_03055 [archaeon]